MYKSASTSDVLGQAQSPAMPPTPLHFFMGKLETGIPISSGPYRTPDYTYKGLFRGGLILSGQILAIWVDFVRNFCRFVRIGQVARQKTRKITKNHQICTDGPQLHLC